MADMKYNDLCIPDRDTLYHTFLRQKMKPRFYLPIASEDVEKLFLAAYMAEVTSRGVAFRKSSELERIVNTVVNFLVDRYGSSFGLYLCGNTGNGKTSMMKALQQVIAYVFRDESYDERKKLIISDARSITFSFLENKDKFNCLAESELLCIDELGTEPMELQVYGTKYNPIIDLLTKRYDKRLFTCVTTNLTPKEIVNKYGTRLSDRFKEMFCLVNFDGESYRG